VTPRGSTNVRRLATGIATVLVIGSCRQIVGIGDSPPAGSGGPGGSDDASALAEGSADADACTSCLGTSCSAELTACDADAGCAQSLACLLACAPGDEACAGACTLHASQALWSAISCRAQSCATACGTTCGGILGALYPDYLRGSPGCAACAANYACTELTTCATSASCVAYASCSDRACEPFDEACNTSCRYGVGPTPAGDAIGPALKRCASDCRLGSNWDCVGKRPWPTGVKGTSATFSVRLVDALQVNQPMPGVLARVCPLVDMTCSGAGDSGAGEWSEATTDSTGYVRLSAPMIGVGVFAGYVDFSGGPVYPTLAFQYPPYAGSIAGDPGYTPFLAQALSTGDYDLAAVALGKVGVTIDSTSGTVLLVAYDCLQAAAPGVTFAIAPSSGTSVWYTNGNAIAPQATSTDASGLGVVANVPALTPVVVSARVAATGQLVSQANVFVRTQTLSFVLLAPLPQ
jgi:hypothetical protein